MKLVVAGATGFVGKEVIRQGLAHPSITSIVALARRETPVPENLPANANPAKLTSVACPDFGNYTDDVKRELAGADACIWLIAVTPSKSKLQPWEEVKKICLDYTVTGLETIAKLPRPASHSPLRFIYTSGAQAEPDQTKRPWLLPDYLLMRGEVENRVLAYAKASSGAVEATIAKPGLINGAGRAGAGTFLAPIRGALFSLIGLPKIEVTEVAAALLDQAVDGLEKETLVNDDMLRIAKRALGNGKGASEL